MLFRFLLTLLVIVRDAAAGQRSPKISLGGEGSRIVLPLEKEQCTSICDEVHIAIDSIWLNIFFLQTVALLRLEMSWQDHPQLSTRTHFSLSNHRLVKAVVDSQPNSFPREPAFSPRNQSSPSIAKSVPTGHPTARALATL